MEHGAPKVEMIARLLGAPRALEPELFIDDRARADSIPGLEIEDLVDEVVRPLGIVVDGDEQLALAKDVQRHMIKPVIEHVDLVVVKRGEKVTVDVPVHVEGEAAPETVVTTENATLSVEAPATDIPEFFMVSVEGLEAGTQILAKDITLPGGVTLDSDEELLVVNITQQISAEELEAELAAGVVSTL